MTSLLFIFFILLKNIHQYKKSSSEKSVNIKKGNICYLVFLCLLLLFEFLHKFNMINFYIYIGADVFLFLLFLSVYFFFKNRKQ